MKKLLSLLFVITITVNLCCFTVASAHMGALKDEEETLLKLVNVIDENKGLDDVLTRGEFAQMLAKVAFGLNADVSIYNNGKKVTDVKETDSGYDAVNALYNRGYITVDNFGRFYPEREITTEEATDMAVGVLGYSRTFLKKVFSKNSQSIASEKGLYKGITSSDGKLNLYSAYKLIYNMLTCDVSDLVLFGGNDEKLMYMTSRLFINEIEGIVTDDGFTSIYGESEIRENYIAIDEKVLENGTEYTDLLGYNVKGFYEYSRYNDDEAKLLAIGERSNRNDVLVLRSEEIESFNDRTYIYYEDEFASKSKKIVIPKDIKIIYNGKCVTVNEKFENSMFFPEQGVITFCDNNKDEKTDILKIYDYKTAVVNLVDNSEEKIYLKNDMGVLDISEKKISVENGEGKKLSVADILTDSVISYSKSLDGEYIKILVSNNSFSDTVKSVSKDEDGYVTIVTGMGGKYEFNSHAVNNYPALELNCGYVFKFDSFGKVAAYEKDEKSNLWMYASLISIRYDENESEDELSVAKMYTQNGEIVNLKVNKKVTVIYEDDSVRKILSPEAANIDYTGIIRYKTNYEDVITNIELPHPYGTKPEAKDRLFVLLDTVKTENSKNYYTRNRGSYISYGGVVVLNNNTKVFSVPGDIRKYEDYAMGAVNSFVSGVDYKMYLYGTDPNSKNAVCACLTSGDISTSNITNENPLTVKSVEHIYDENSDEIVYRLKCYDTKGAEKTYDMEPEIYENKVFSYALGDIDSVTQKQIPVKIQAGDMIYYAESGNEITAATLLLDADRILADEKSNPIVGGLAGGKITYYSDANTLCNPFAADNYMSGNRGSANSWMFYSSNVRVWVGWVYSVEDGFMQITNQNPAYGYNESAKRTDGFITEVFASWEHSLITTEKKGSKYMVKVGNTADIKPYTVYGADCSRIVITQRAYDTRSYNILNY